jgi:hypothetical protein
MMDEAKHQFINNFFMKCSCWVHGLFGSKEITSSSIGVGELEFLEEAYLQAHRMNVTKKTLFIICSIFLPLYMTRLFIYFINNSATGLPCYFRLKKILQQYLCKA